MSNDKTRIGLEPLVMRVIDHSEMHASVSPHDNEQLQWETDLSDAAELITSMRQCISLLTGGDCQIKHIYQGNCPDETQPLSRDNDCPACRLLIRFSA